MDGELEMRTEKFGVVLLVFVGHAWCRQSDEDDTRSVRVNYGGWRPIRGRNHYARKLNDSKIDPSQRNLYVVVPSELVNAAKEPAREQPIHHQEDYHPAESQVKQLRALDAEPFPVSEPITDLRTFIGAKFEDQQVQESQQSEVFHQTIFPGKPRPFNGERTKLHNNHPSQKEGNDPTFEISHQGVLQLKPIGIIPNFPNTGHFQHAEDLNVQENNLRGLRGFKQEGMEVAQEQRPHPNFHKNDHHFGLRIRNQETKLVEEKFKQQNFADNAERIHPNAEGYENIEYFEGHSSVHSSEKRLPPKRFHPSIRPNSANQQLFQSNNEHQSSVVTNIGQQPSVVNDREHQSSVHFQKTLGSQLHFGENTELKDHYEKGETQFISQIDKTVNAHPSSRPYPSRGTYFPPLINPNINVEPNNAVPFQPSFRPSVGPAVPHGIRQEFVSAPQPPQPSLPNCAPRISNENHNLENSLEQITERYDANLLFQHVPLSQNGLLRLISAGGPYTLFLPSNEVILRLPQPLLQKWKRNPQSLMFILLNHAVHGRVTLSDLREKKLVESKSSNALLYINDYRNETVTINGRRIITADIPGPHGGAIHIIDGILHPPADKDIIDTITVCDRFDGFLTLADAADVTGYLRGAGPFTLLLPSNDALMKIEKEDMDILKSNITALREFLLYHIVEGVYYGGDLLDGQYLQTAYQEHSIKAGIRVDGCYRRFAEVNNSPVYRADIPARNGVVHVIDWVIRPTDLDWCEGMVLP
ncbi:uncharacterized protein [Centruroides vittatus]|uniref:uncharacterized protein n=1 Tax=Centruroides vittatus TaxID=120091 RepID=UPI00350F8246